MYNFLNYIGMIGIDSSQEIVISIVRIVLAAILGAAIGLERGRKHRPAGLRTHMLVCVASALVMITNEQLMNASEIGDPTRMGAQVISGIGFLGAGTILTDRQNRVRGLTTAAGLWASACMGLAVGAGFYMGAILTCALILLIFTKFIDIEHRYIRKGRFMEMNLSFDGSENLNDFLSAITSNDCSIISIEYINLAEERELQQSREKKLISINLHILLPKKNYHNEILHKLGDSKGLIFLEEV